MYQSAGIFPHCLQSTSKNELHLLIVRLSHAMTEFIALEDKIHWFQSIIADKNFSKVIITSTNVNEISIALISKLYNWEFWIQPLKILMLIS